MGSHGEWTHAQVLSPVLPTLGKASWILTSSTTLWASNGVLGKTLPDCGGQWVGGEKDINPHLHPLSQQHRTTPNQKLGGREEGADAGEI